MGKKRIVAGVVVVALAAAGGILGYREYRANATVAAACETITVQIEERGPVIHLPGAKPSVAILGDSYTSGDGLAHYGDAWAHHFTALSGSEAHIAGIGNTGYTNGGFCGTHQFRTRIEDFPAHDVLIIQGGLNDWEASPEEIQSAAEALFSSADAASVVVVGPPSAPSRDGLAMVDETLRNVAEDHDHQYISALDWELPFLPDDLHLTEAGHKQFAEQVNAEIVLP